MENLFKLLERLFLRVTEENGVIFLTSNNLREKSNPLNLTQEAMLLISYVNSACSILKVEPKKAFFVSHSTNTHPCLYIGNRDTAKALAKRFGGDAIPIDDYYVWENTTYDIFDAPTAKNFIFKTK